MNTIRLTKEFSFEMAHALHCHDGDCANIHGHSYQFSVTFIGKPKNKKENPKNGMLVDFKDIKQLIQDSIINIFDHSLVLNESDPTYQQLKKSNIQFKILSTSYQPTCENLIIEFAKRIKVNLNKDIKLYALKLKETSSSYVEWYSTDN